MASCDQTTRLAMTALLLHPTNSVSVVVENYRVIALMLPKPTADEQRHFTDATGIRMNWLRGRGMVGLRSWHRRMGWHRIASA
ncbi:hypothetical protein BU24DRAFT_426380 [Aaosphaeria arxii CBS 175.79]|uniref:Uncharacterized protein n=1 Tax=Aaosphaeria arxii CBS 175.79 TaxID=1450172 RepID=A0A6A5XE42_9PLEO|nr:uncharacterized protein BU24DRAFT_426380 [Aaosphaeria arxii CBS 175.79]KAF2011298.1 hypothetical protein BU24DRAFT_426380 [Aaosphaeria arxii CBS 175.79]